MPNQPLLAVVSSGVVSSVGLSAPATFAAIRGGIDAFQNTSYLDAAKLPIVGAMIPRDVLGLPGEADGLTQGGDEKLARMVAMAATECASGFDLGKLALLLVGPEEGRLVFSRGIDACLTACAEAFGQELHEDSRVFQHGSPGLVDALIFARDLLLAQKVKSVLIAGVDSLLGADDIHEGLLERRVLSTGASDGYVPGEAAGCVLVTRPAERPVGAASCLFVAGLGTSSESCTLAARRRSTGVGLSTAIRQALGQAGVSAHEVHARFADVTAEPYFFEEASYAWGRLLRAASPVGHKLHTPVTRLGHVGAAMGPLLLAFVLDEVRRGLRPLPNALIHLSTSGAARAAALLVASYSG